VELKLDNTWSVREVEDTVAVFTVDAVTVYEEEYIQSVGITVINIIITIIIIIIIIITISIKSD